MKIFLISLKMLWRRKFASILLIVEVVLSVIVFSQMMVYILDLYNNRKAVNELPQEDVLLLTSFEYTDIDDLMDKLNSSYKTVDIGTGYTGYAYYGGNTVNLTAYNDALMDIYTPSLKEGTWLSEAGQDPEGSLPVVATSGLGLQAGDCADITIMGRQYHIYVCGVLAGPAGYLFPSSYASSELFSADLLISHKEGFIMRAGDFPQVSDVFGMMDFTKYRQLLFIRNQQGMSENEIMRFREEFSRYGEITDMNEMVKLFYKNSSDMIQGGAIFFIVFFVLAVLGLISNYLVQLGRNRKVFTIYYLNGMKWETCAIIESVRTVILVVLTMLVSILAGRLGLLMTSWVSGGYIAVFYTCIAAYIIVIFAAVSAVFIRKLAKTDISVQLKDLGGGE